MGAWGIGNFDNDLAMDWLIETEQPKSNQALLHPIRAILSNTNDLDEPSCTEALAAAGVIAALHTQDFSSIPEFSRTWLEKKKIKPYNSKISI